MPIVSPQDEAAVKSIVEADLVPRSSRSRAAWSTTSTRPRSAASTASWSRSHPPGTSSSGRTAGRSSGQSRPSIEATLAAKEEGLYTVFFTIDSSRAEFDWYLDLVARVATEGHMDALALVDTFGGVTPQAIPVWVEKVRERLPDTPLEAHFHDDFGLAVANSIAAVAVRRRAGPHHGDRGRRARRQHSDGGDGAGADDAVRRRARRSTRAVLLALAPRSRARRPHHPFEPPCGRRASVRGRVGNHRRLVPRVHRRIPDRAVPVPLGRGRPAAGADRVRKGQRPALRRGRARGPWDRGRRGADARARRGDQATGAETKALLPLDEVARIVLDVVGADAKRGRRWPPADRVIG